MDFVAFSQQALHDLTLVGERSPTLILCPEREGLRVQPTRSLVFSGAALGERVECFVGKAGQCPTSMKGHHTPTLGAQGRPVNALGLSTPTAGGLAGARHTRPDVLTPAVGQCPSWRSEATS